MANDDIQVMWKQTGREFAEISVNDGEGTPAVKNSDYPETRNTDLSHGREPRKDMLAEIIKKASEDTASQIYEIIEKKLEIDATNIQRDSTNIDPDNQKEGGVSKGEAGTNRTKTRNFLILGIIVVMVISVMVLRIVKPDFTEIFEGSKRPVPDTQDELDSSVSILPDENISKEEASEEDDLLAQLTEKRNLFKEAFSVEDFIEKVAEACWDIELSPESDETSEVSNNLRMLSEALRKLGINDMPGELDLQHLEGYLLRHGFYCPYDKNDIRRGDIVLIREKKDSDERDEAELYVIDSYDSENHVCKKYDLSKTSSESLNLLRNYQPVLSEMEDFDNKVERLELYRIIEEPDFANRDPQNLESVKQSGKLDIIVSPEGSDVRESMYGRELYPVFSAKGTSSKRMDSNYNDFRPQSAFDNDYNTCWITEENDNRYLEMSFAYEKSVDLIAIYSGNWTSEEGYNKYSVPCKILLEFRRADDEVTFQKEVELSEDRTPQYIRFSNPIIMKSLSIIVEDVYERENGGCIISEVQMFSELHNEK